MSTFENTYWLKIGTVSTFEKEKKEKQFSCLLFLTATKS